MKKLIEIKSKNKILLARIEVTEDELIIFPVQNIYNLHIKVKGNGFNYNSYEENEELTGTIE